MEEQKPPPEKDAVEHILARKDKSSLRHRFIDHFKGKGLVSHKTIEPSEFVVEYRGKISYHKGKGRRKKYGENNYLYEFSWKGLNWCIDASREYRSLGRLVNDDHVNPNCEMKNIVCGGKPHMCLFAVRQISPGEEITYNYGDYPYPWRSMLEDSGTSDAEESFCDDDDKLPDTGPSQDNDRSANSQLDVRDGSPQEMMESVTLQPDDASCSKQDESALITDEHSSDEEYLPNEDIQEPKEPTFARKNYCYVCGKGMTKLTRHFLRHADEETEIAGAFALPIYSKERKRLFEDLRNRGNYKHNQEVLRNNSGELKLKRRPSKANVSAKAFALCLHCKGLYKRRDLSRHVERCHSRKRSCPVTLGKTRALSEVAVAGSSSSENRTPTVWRILSSMKNDEIAVIVQKDILLKQLAQHLFEKHGNDRRKHGFIRQKLRAMGSLLLVLHDKSIFNFQDVLKPRNFHKLVETVKGMAAFDEKKQSYGNPRLVLKIRRSLKNLFRLILTSTDNDKKVVKDTEQFMKLCETEWSGIFSRAAHASGCVRQKVNSTSTIPFTRDVQDFYRYLETTSASAIKTLKMYENPQVYNVLSKLTLAQLTVLNKGAPEVSKMSLKSFQERDDSTRVLSKHFIRINVVSKNRLKVAVLLTPELVSAITLLVDKRQNCGVHEDNPFLFAKPDRTDSSVYSGVHCIRSFSNLCEAKNPEHLRLVHLQKHIARVFQILNLENNELDHLAKLLGRDIRADRDYYRLPGAAVELAKIAKLLLAMEKGALEKFKGISLDEMEIEDELEPDVEMCKPKDSDTEEDSDESDVPPLQNENVKRPCRKRTPEKDALEHIKTRRDKPFLQEMLIDTIKGKGVFTHQSIEPSSFVVEYRGNISTRTETRGKERGDTLNNYLFDFSWNGTNWRVDASKNHGGLGRLVNDDHVSPNCEMKKIVFEEKPHLCLFAVKEIHRGEEITYDYGDSAYPWRSTTTSEELNSTQTHLKDAASSPEDEMVEDFEAFSSEESCGDDEYVPGPDEEPSSAEYDNEVKDDDEQKNNPDVVDSSEQQPTDDSPVQLEDDSNERDAINLSPANKNYCYVCGKPQSKISRHLLTHRHEEADIAQVFALRRNSKERKKQMDDLRKRGNYKHNQEVLKTCRGELKVSKRSKVSLTNSNLFAPCLYCKGMYSRKLMWRHVRKCSNKLFKGAIGPKTKVLTLVATTVSTEPREMTSYVRDVLKNLNNDEISSAVREDCYLLRLAQCLCFTNKTKKQSEYIRRKLREMGRVLLKLRKKSISCFEDAVKPENFSKVVEAVKELSGFREETQSCDRPTFAQKLGETLKKIGDISYAVALKEDADKETIHQAETFMRLCAEEWGPRSKSFIKNPSTILFTQDAQLLYQCIEKTAASAVQSLTMYESPPVYNALLRVTLAQAAILNANVFKKVPRVTLKSFQERDDAELHTDASVGRSQLEQILCKRFVTINVMSKAERKGHDKEIALMLTPELLSAITLLVSKRESCGVHALNSFLFARPVAIRTSFYQGQTCISLFVARCGAKNLETQRPALFRKHMVRTYQILSLTNDELDQLAKLLGRDIQTDRDYYQKPEAAGDIAKISELLSEMENGSVERFEGTSFEDIEIPDELQPDLKECDSDNNDANEDCEDAESSVLSRDSSPQKRVSSSKKRGRRKRKKSESEESVQDEEEHDEGDAESDDQSEEVPAKCAEETPSRSNEEATNVSFSDEDTNVDFDMDEDTDDDVRNDNRDGDVGSDGSAAMPPRTQVKGRTEQDEDVSDNKKERSPHKNSTDTDPEETMDVDAEETDKVTGGEGADSREVDTSGSSAALNTEKKKRLLAQMNGMKKVNVLIPKLDINLQNPVHISQLPPAFKKWLEKDQPLQDDDDNEPETSSSSTNHPTTEEATYMTCSHCEKSMMKGQTAYQKKGFTHVFCSKSCLFEKFPVNKPDTKTCHSCHKAITQPLDLVMAVVDARGTVKDFCALTCLCLFKSVHAPAQTPQSLCSMCNKSCAATCELSLTQAVHKFCNKSCLDGFCRDNMPACDNCSSHCQKQPLMLELEEDGTKTICSEECLTEFKEKTETPQPCSMCLTSQQMSDMVNYKSIEGTVKLFCNRGCMVSYQLKPAAQENKRKAWLKKKKKGQQTKQKTNTEGVSVVSGSTVDGAAASQAAEEPTLISAALCVSCRTCETRMMKGQTVYQLKSSSDVFCSASCFTQMNPHIKVVTKHCHNCFQVILQPLKVILAPVGDVGTMKKLCGETCLASVNSRMSTAVLKTQPQVGYHKVNNLTAPQCDICASTCTDDQFLLKMEDSRVCSKECLVKFKEKVKTPQMCPMCQTSHQLSDMVEDKDQDGRLDFFCSNRCSVVYKAQFLTQSAKTSSSSEERNIKDVTPKDVKPKLDFIKQEPVDEGYNQNLPPGVATEHIKDEPNVTKDLKTDPVFFLTTDSPPSEDTSLCHVDLKLSCLSCKKTLMDGETVYQRKDHADIFCSTACILTFYQMKPVRKTCQFCLEEVRESQDVLQFPVEPEGTLKDFCSRACLSSFNYKKVVSTKIPIVPLASHSQCSMCGRYCISKHEIIKQGLVHKICSDPCFFRFCNMNNLSLCQNCHCRCNTLLTLKMKEGSKKLCTAACVAQVKKTIRTLQPCVMCQSSCPASDMVETITSENVVELFCTNSCVMAAKIQAASVSGAPLNCDNCGRNTLPACHLAMPDATIRNFCTLACAMTFKETQKDTSAPSHLSGASDPTTSDFLKPPENLLCAQCRRIIRTSPKVVQQKGKVTFVCSLACSQEFKRVTNITTTCEYCRTEGIARDAKRIDSKDCFFCSDGCKILFSHELERKWGKHCDSCAYCRSGSRTVLTANYAGKKEEFCSEVCMSKYNMLYCCYAKCDTCSHKGKLRESLSMLGEVKHFCDLRCVLHFCNKRLQVVNTDSSSPESAGAAASSPIITSVISLASLLAQQNKTLSSTTQHASSSPESSRQAESSPVITSVVSLASHLARRNKTSSSTTQHESVPEIQTKVVGHASVQTAPRELKNKSVLCSPLVHNKGVSCTTATVDAEAQTDNFVPQVIVLPLPVPAYVPLPMNMYSQYTPQPVGLPVPLPVPIFLPVALDRPDPAMKERVEPPEADLHLRSETGTQQDDRSGRENGLRAEELTTEDERQETQDLNEHTSSFDDDLDKNDLGSFNLQEHSFTDVSLWSPGQPHTPAPPPIREEPASSAPAPPPSQQTLLSKVHNKNEGPKLPQLCKATKEETFQRDLSKLMSRKQHKQKSQCGIDAWKRWIQGRKSQTNLDPVSFKENVLLCSAAELSDGLCCFVNEVKQADGEPHPPDSLFYLCLSIQQFLFENDRMENIFSDVIYSQFTTEFTKILKRLRPSVTAAGYVQSCVEEEFLWECKQLGAYSPIVLLNTLLFFCCKNFGFTTVEQHRQLSFTQLTCCTRTNLNHTRTTSLRFYPPISTTEALPDGVPAKKRKKDNVENFLEMMENTENPLHCPVRLYEFYLSKCSESVKQRSDWFSLGQIAAVFPQQPTGSPLPPLDGDTMEAMLAQSSQSELQDRSRLNVNTFQL
ncbi:uncharacterized protein LOC118124568 [Hippoglossus stenolepis]|uniref:uncharacterized protein LOC118124568 n=1 Tax=Hippoglossus stenolepis TaxID=195615 RepID=UPI001FB03F66|nr:uncharacterized protein LOC118124568 [Hippoglossus stenolepis]